MALSVCMSVRLSSSSRQSTKQSRVATPRSAREARGVATLHYAHAWQPDARCSSGQSDSHAAPEPLQYLQFDPHLTAHALV